MANRYADSANGAAATTAAVVATVSSVPELRYRTTLRAAATIRQGDDDAVAAAAASTRSIALPDLVVWPEWEDAVKTNALIVECFRFPELRAHPIDAVVAASATENFNVVNAVLEPHFSRDGYDRQRSGTRTTQTTWELNEAVPAFRVFDRAPRLVLWKRGEPLTVCSTETMRLDSAQDLPDAMNRAMQWATRHRVTQERTLAVFDLDETLIDCELRILPGAIKLLRAARKRYDIVVLYSHGSPLHVSEAAARIRVPLDLVLSNSENEARCQKNLLQLYNYFPNTIFTRATLVDDSMYNWAPEYTRMLIPYQLRLGQLEKCL